MTFTITVLGHHDPDDRMLVSYEGIECIECGTTVYVVEGSPRSAKEQHPEADVHVMCVPCFTS